MCHMGSCYIVGDGCDYDLHYVLRYTLKGNSAPSKIIYCVLAVRVKC